MLLLGLIIGLVIGAAVGWVLRPKLEMELSHLPFIQQPVAMMGTTLTTRIEEAIAEIENQLRVGIDSERNSTRLAMLREVKDGN